MTTFAATNKTAPAGPAGHDAPEPTWEIADVFPAQGAWSEAEYLAMNVNRLLEYSHGRPEVLATPTQAHQLVVAFLYQLLLAFASARKLGVVLFAPLRVRLWPGKYREPDVVFMLAEHAARRSNDFWDGADLVMEVVSDEDRRRDTETKRFEYARAGIPEYWIVDPSKERITVLRLEGNHYVTHGEFERGGQAHSALLAGFGVDAAAVFDSGKEKA
jgi:Uma2 family endonuclease